MNHGDAAVAPAEPSREGYTFTGWDKEFTNVTSDLTVKAEYKIKTYTVTFVDYDGTEISVQTVNHGGTLEEPNQPERLGYEFLYWYFEVDGEEFVLDFNILITEDLTVFAKYQALTFTVSFFANDGLERENGDLESITVIFDQPYANLPEVTLQDHEFIGWFTTLLGGELVTESTLVEIAEDHTLYARWRALWPTPYSVEFVANGGELN